MKYIPFIILTIILTITVYITQISAIGAGFEVWLGVPPFFTYIFAFLFGWVPPFGSIVATVAAVDVWNWNWFQAILVFFGIYIWYGVMFAFGLFEAFKGAKWIGARLSEKMAKKNAERMSPRQEPEIIDQDGNNILR